MNGGILELNADFSLRAVQHGATLPWKDSPVPGVRRRMLERIGDEVARATTIVRYEPNSKFLPHVHGGGEEFIVLEGVFQDEHGAYPEGSYIRNPPQSRHTPGSTPGCILFVKLWQFDLADRTHVRLNFDKMEAIAATGRPGVTVTPLFRDERENVRIETWNPGARTLIDTAGGAEVFVIDGEFAENGQPFRRHSWLRIPIGERAEAVAGPLGARVWIKSGHLRFARRPGEPETIAVTGNADRLT